jgi:hypothetical protein
VVYWRFQGVPTTSSHLNKGERIVGKGDHSQKNDKKNKKVKQNSKKQAAKSSNKK